MSTDIDRSHLPDDHRAAIASFADAVVAKDFSAAAERLAPWLTAEKGAAPLTEAVEAAITEMRAAWELSDDTWPARYSIDTNSLSIEDLRRETWGIGSDLPPEITSENFLGWRVLQFQTEDDDELEIDAWFDMWFALVSSPDGPLLGSFELTDPD